jgi:hypothetical protein
MDFAVDYPEGIGILKELLQNADDTKANSINNGDLFY